MASSRHNVLCKVLCKLLVVNSPHDTQKPCEVTALTLGAVGGPGLSTLVRHTRTELGELRHSALQVVSFRRNRNTIRASAVLLNINIMHIHIVKKLLRYDGYAHRY